MVGLSHEQRFDHHRGIDEDLLGRTPISPLERMDAAHERRTPARGHSGLAAPDRPDEVQARRRLDSGGGPSQDLLLGSGIRNLRRRHRR